jgi:hypothetical protein
LNFKLFFRTDVSTANPEGADWLEINLPDNHQAQSISCSNDGDLWLVTCEGRVLMRNGISESQPFGQSWLHLKSELSFVKITSCLNNVYGLDSLGNVHIRTETSLNNKAGLSWKKILKGLADISVSMSNQVQ